MTTNESEHGAIVLREPMSGPRGLHGTQNLCVLALQIAGWAALLTIVDDARLPWWVRALAVVTFCCLMQGVFSMMHEYFHHNAHRSRRMNALIGVIGALLFGTSATLHRINHWGHHVRNRSAAERGEFIHEGESALQKTFLYYTATMGGLWLAGLLVPIAALFVPYSAVALLAREPRFNTYRAAFAQFRAQDWTRVRIDALLLVAFFAALVVLEVWRWQTLLVCYAAFAYSWSSLQWIYHLRTPIDRVEGAYNLRLPVVVRWLFLNFNYNLTHHRHPHLPWQALPAASDPREMQPLWYRYLLMFLPPVRFPDDLSALDKRYF